MLKRFIAYYLATLVLILTSVALADSWYQQASQTSANSLLVEMGEAFCQVQDCTREQQISQRVSVMPLASIGFAIPENAPKNAYQYIHTTQGERAWLYIISQDNQRVFRVDTSAEKRNGLIYTWLFYIVLAGALLALTLPFVIAFYHIKRAATEFAKTRDYSLWYNRRSFLFQSVIDAMAYMAHRLSHLLALQRELSNTLSHEARTIISRISMTLTNAGLHERDRALFKEDLKELEILSDEYLRLSKYEHEQRLQLSQIELPSLLAQLIKPYQRFGSKQVTLQAPDSLSIYSDERLLRWAFRNLIDNGVKYAQSRVHIQVLEVGEQWQFIIEDDGPGVKQSQIEGFFMPFNRPENSIKKGYGYGLAIVKKVTELLHGTIEVSQSPSLGGGCFVMCFRRRLE
ncbi:sensor histidine kinase [Pseudoalteromonas sp. T1lg88]|uniref:sensor histidine kinase n=1 Tax=Pseudoalteromonas sp. T1lg88 TaxID=2077104 RepID=UPI000CF74737|nr:HAMP domain-containing sensor histidine kinase [Pseudoalteromonas sp. T1lg88]